MKRFLSQSLSEHDMMEAMDIMMSHATGDTDIAEFLTALSQRGETVDEITGAARYFREKCISLNAPADAVDCCGTGGDGKITYNISTAAALVAAACGVPVAKHGNRAASSKSGAADVLEACGVHLDLSPQALEEALQRFNFAFLMAPTHHPGLVRVRMIRKAMGIRSIFNLLGPLLNPAHAKIQLIGVYDRALVPKMAAALHRLGSHKAWTVHGSDGMDEVTLGGPTYRTILQDGVLTDDILNPDDFGFEIRQDAKALTGGEADCNARALIALLEGEKNAYRDIVLVNSAAILMLHGSVASLKEGVARAALAIDERAALQILKNYRDFSHKEKSS